MTSDDQETFERDADWQRHRRMRIAARKMLLEAALVELVTALSAEGVRSVLLKGPAFADWLYDDPLERPFRDIDLLISPEGHETARQIMVAHGFREIGTRVHERAAHHTVWQRDRPEGRVELHSSLGLVTAPEPVGWEVFARDARPWSLRARSSRCRRSRLRPVWSRCTPANTVIRRAPTSRISTGR